MSFAHQAKTLVLVSTVFFFTYHYALFSSDEINPVPEMISTGTQLLRITPITNIPGCFEDDNFEVHEMAVSPTGTTIALVGLNKQTSQIQVRAINLDDLRKNSFLTLNVDKEHDVFSLAWSTQDSYLAIHDLSNKEITIVVISHVDGIQVVKQFNAQGIDRLIWLSDSYLLYAVDQSEIKATIAPDFTPVVVGISKLDFDQLDSVNYFIRDTELIIAAKVNQNFFLYNVGKHEWISEIAFEHPNMSYLNYYPEIDSLLFSQPRQDGSVIPVLANVPGTTRLTYDILTDETIAPQMNQNGILAVATLEGTVCLFSKNGHQISAIRPTSLRAVSSLIWGTGSYRHSLFVAYDPGSVIEITAPPTRPMFRYP